MEKNLLKIKETIEQILRVMDFTGEVIVENQSEGSFCVKIQTSEAAFLIGRGGENLMALQHLSRAIVSKELGEPAQFIVDINDYQSNRLELLREMALNLAQEVVRQGEAKRLEPMNAYERRVVHLALVDFPGVKTESEGEREDRRIVIRPINN